ncbi:MAG: hypothetical protein R3194_05470 [Limnobacter sp.]|nr:hypothetical protein [Limnobacter sp.]
MDQAESLRSLLGQAQYQIEPILADVGSSYLKPLCQALLKHHARRDAGSLIFDGGFLVAEPQRKLDLMSVLENRSSLEDIAKPLLPNQFLVQAIQAFAGLSSNLDAVSLFEQKMHRLPGTCDFIYATLAKPQVALAERLAKSSACFWLVEPTSKSVTETFKAIRYSDCQEKAMKHRIIVVGAASVQQADDVFASLQDVLPGSDTSALQYCGHVPKLETGKNNSKVTQACERVVKVMATGRAPMACI